MLRIRYFEILSLAVLASMIYWVVAARPRVEAIAESEAKAVEWLERIAIAQQQWHDATGEYAFLSELLEGTKDTPAALDVRAESLSTGRYLLPGSGYVFRSFLPAGTEPVADGDAIGPDPEERKEAYGVYAWPLRYGATGKRTLFLHGGEIFQTENRGIPYDGERCEPRWDAAMRDASLGLTGDAVDDQAHGSDTKIWERLGAGDEGEDEDEDARDR